MPTVQDWITRSLRMLGVLGMGQVAAGQMGANALEAANGLIAELPEIGRVQMTDVIVSANYTARENERVVNVGGDDVVITLPELVEECGRQRPPKTGSRVIIAGDAPLTYLYVPNSGWEKVSGLSLTDPAPLGNTAYTGLCALLAVHLAPEFDQAASQEVIALGTAGRLTIANQFWAEQEVVGSEEFAVGPDMGFGNGFDPY